jgi:hypothetical protein
MKVGLMYFDEKKLLNQGDQIGRFFTNWATFGGSLWKDEVAQNNSYFLGCFLFKQIYYIYI